MSSTVLDVLSELQKVADKIDIFDKETNSAKENSDRVKENLEKAKKKLADLEQESHTLDIERRKKELKLKEEKDRQARIKNRTGDVKTSREYQAVRTENNTVKQNINTVEEDILGNMETLETLSKEMDALRESIGRIEGDAVAASADYDEAVKRNTSQVAELKEEEKRLLARLPNDAASRYKLIRSRRGGLAVVEARNEACTACHMRIPPQVYIEIMKQTGVYQCQNCHRILVPPKKAEG